MKFGFKQGTSICWILMIVTSVELVMASQILANKDNESSIKLPTNAPCAVCSTGENTDT